MRGGNWLQLLEEAGSPSDSADQHTLPAGSSRVACRREDSGLPRPSSPPTTGGRDRGQTTLDYAIGMSFFLIVLIGMLTFITGVLTPFTQGAQDEFGIADRVGDRLAEGTLGDPATPHLLNTDCTVAFFEDRSPSECRYSGENLTSRVGVDHRQRINITVHADLAATSGRTVLCWDRDGQELVSRTAATCDVPLRIGPPTPDQSTTISAQRVVTVESTDATLEVEVW